eukprot:TRINITY_DN12656_c0_g1_i1.p1 TRINITY_DN12656_c0_g1~~TRINITY_DN12656_c0_g1_i1.p1  ORF type:complete len:174 (-),score=11.18 TRINITY_DN12656_c0_g1_i1:166-687(-)
MCIRDRSTGTAKTEKWMAEDSTAAGAEGATANQSTQLQCTGCDSVLAYPRTAREVVCPICRASNTPTECIIRCPRCESDLVFPTAAEAIVCGVCDLPLKTQGGSADSAVRTQNIRSLPTTPLTESVIVVSNPSRKGKDGRVWPVLSLAKLVRGPGLLSQEPLLPASDAEHKAP